MIDYDPGQMQFLFIFQCVGSVFPKAFCWGALSGLFSIVVKLVILPQMGLRDQNIGVSQVWASYNFILGFMLVFRNQQAYMRFWQGISTLQRVRGEWVNATSSLFAFSTPDTTKAEEVDKFQHLLVRLMSLLYCTALQNIAVMQEENFEIIELGGIDENLIDYLVLKPNEKIGILQQWIQRIIVKAMREGVVDVPPPILTRAFQELSRGIVELRQAQEICDIPFPFPYAQMVALMLIMTTFITPLVSSLIMESTTMVSMLSFLSIFLLWSVNFIAAELECPFGNDANDLPVPHLQKEMNSSLMMLLEPEAQQVPQLLIDPPQKLITVSCPERLCQSEGVTLLQSLEGVLDDPTLKRKSNRKQRRTKAQVRMDRYKSTEAGIGRSSLCRASVCPAQLSSGLGSGKFALSTAGRSPDDQQSLNSAGSSCCGTETSVSSHHLHAVPAEPSAKQTEITAPEFGKLRWPEIFARSRCNGDDTVPREFRSPQEAAQWRAAMASMVRCSASEEFRSPQEAAQWRGAMASMVRCSASEDHPDPAKLQMDLELVSKPHSAEMQMEFASKLAPVAYHPTANGVKLPGNTGAITAHHHSLGNGHTSKIPL